MSKPVRSAIAAATAFSIVFGDPVAAVADSVAEDAYWCWGCEVLEAGPAADRNTVFIRLADPNKKFTTAYFDGKKNPEQFLATALTAISFRKRVNANVLGTVDFSVIDRMYLLQS